MAWKQIKKFDPNKMGSKKGYCLQNTRLAFGIAAKYASAKDDMEAQKKAGTLRPISEIPSNCAVPVFCDTSSKYEHVLVCDRGQVWSDGKKISGGLSKWKCFGWGETLCGVRVVEKVADPTPSTGFLPAKGYWGYGDNDVRVGQLAAFMRQVFPAYTSAKALGNLYGPYLQAAIKEFQSRTGLEQDGNTGPKTYAKLKEFGFSA